MGIAGFIEMLGYLTIMVLSHDLCVFIVGGTCWVNW
jgi:hypothetical protein